MQGNTHRVGGMLCALAGYTLLEEKGMLIQGVNPILQLTIMYSFAIYGSVFPDLDHHEESIPTHDIVSVGVNKLLHATSNIRRAGGRLSPFLSIFDAKHRSWQTHSDLFLGLCLFLSFNYIDRQITTANGVIAKLIFTGFILGVVSHMLLDMITSEGIWCIGLKCISDATGRVNLPKKVHLVPKSKFFATGGAWEKLVRYIMWVACSILFIRILYGMLPYHFI